MADDGWGFSASEIISHDEIAHEELELPTFKTKARKGNRGKWKTKGVYINLKGEILSGNAAYSAAIIDADRLQLTAAERALLWIRRFYQVHPGSSKQWDAQAAEPRAFAHWGVPAPVIAELARQGIQQLYHWQAECLLKAASGCSMLACAPTSGGKSMIADILAFRMMLGQEKSRKIIMVVPFVSLAIEKTAALRPMCEALNLTVEAMYNNRGPGTMEGIDIAVATIERAAGLINRILMDVSDEAAGDGPCGPTSGTASGRGQLDQQQCMHPACDQLGLVVFDELHMVGEEGRGYLVELMVQKLLMASGLGRGPAVMARRAGSGDDEGMDTGLSQASADRLREQRAEHTGAAAVQGPAAATVPGAPSAGPATAVQHVPNTSGHAHAGQVHLIGSAGQARRPGAPQLKAGPGVQILGISATLPNVQLLRAWLGGKVTGRAGQLWLGKRTQEQSRAPGSASEAGRHTGHADDSDDDEHSAALYMTTYRPVPLRQFVVAGGVVYDEQTRPVRMLARVHAQGKVLVSISVQQPRHDGSHPASGVSGGGDGMSVSSGTAATASAPHGASPQPLVALPRDHVAGVVPLAPNLGTGIVPTGWQSKRQQGQGSLPARSAGAGAAQTAPVAPVPGQLTTVGHLSQGGTQGQQQQQYHSGPSTGVQAPRLQAPPLPVLDTDGYTPSDVEGMAEIVRLVAESVAEGHSVLIFCPFRSDTEAAAKAIRKGLAAYAAGQALFNDEATRPLRAAMCGALRLMPSGAPEDLIDLVRDGIAFHHAGLTVEERALIEGGFRERPYEAAPTAASAPQPYLPQFASGGSSAAAGAAAVPAADAAPPVRPRTAISVLCATTTVAQGVNLPARRVIFLRLEQVMGKDQWLTVTNYRQMAGRAGRAGKDEVGEVYMVARRAVVTRTYKGTALVQTGFDKQQLSESTATRMWPLPDSLMPPDLPATAKMPAQYGRDVNVPQAVGPVHLGQGLVSWTHLDVPRILGRVRAKLGIQAPVASAGPVGPVTEAASLGPQGHTHPGTSLQHTAPQPRPGGAPLPVALDDTELDLAYRLMHDPLPAVQSTLLPDLLQLKADNSAAATSGGTLASSSQVPPGSFTSTAGAQSLVAASTQPATQKLPTSYASEATGTAATASAPTVNNDNEAVYSGLSVSWANMSPFDLSLSRMVLELIATGLLKTVCTWIRRVNELYVRLELQPSAVQYPHLVAFSESAARRNGLVTPDPELARALRCSLLFQELLAQEVAVHKLDTNSDASASGADADMGIEAHDHVDVQVLHDADRAVLDRLMPRVLRVLRRLQDDNFIMASVDEPGLRLYAYGAASDSGPGRSANGYPTAGTKRKAAAITDDDEGPGEGHNDGHDHSHNDDGPPVDGPSTVELARVRLLPTALGRAAVSSSLDPRQCYCALMEMVKVRQDGLVLDGDAHCVFLMTHDDALPAGSIHLPVISSGAGVSKMSTARYLKEVWGRFVETRDKEAPASARGAASALDRTGVSSAALGPSMTGGGINPIVAAVRAPAVSLGLSTAAATGAPGQGLPIATGQQQLTQQQSLLQVGAKVETKFTRPFDGFTYWCPGVVTAVHGASQPVAQPSLSPLGQSSPVQVALTVRVIGVTMSRNDLQKYDVDITVPADAVRRRPVPFLPVQLGQLQPGTVVEARFPCESKVTADTDGSAPEQVAVPAYYPAVVSSALDPDHIELQFIGYEATGVDSMPIEYLRLSGAQQPGQPGQPHDAVVDASVGAQATGITATGTGSATMITPGPGTRGPMPSAAGSTCVQQTQPVYQTQMADTGHITSRSATASATAAGGTAAAGKAPAIPAAVPSVGLQQPVAARTGTGAASGPGSSGVTLAPQRTAHDAVRDTARMLGITKEDFANELTLKDDRSGKKLTPAAQKRCRRWLASLILREVIRGEELDVLVNQGPDAGGFYIQRGNLAQLQSATAMYGNQLQAMCEQLGWLDLKTIFQVYTPRLDSGVRPELLPLLELAAHDPPIGTNRMNPRRAQDLYKKGIHTLEALAGPAALVKPWHARGHGRDGGTNVAAGARPGAGGDGRPGGDQDSDFASWVDPIGVSNQIKLVFEALTPHLEHRRIAAGLVHQALGTDGRARDQLAAAGAGAGGTGSNSGRGPTTGILPATAAAGAPFGQRPGHVIGQAFPPPGVAASGPSLLALGQHAHLVNGNQSNGAGHPAAAPAAGTGYRPGMPPVPVATAASSVPATASLMPGPYAPRPTQHVPQPTSGHGSGPATAPGHGVGSANAAVDPVAEQVEAAYRLAKELVTTAGRYIRHAQKAQAMKGVAQVKTV